jgi:hypothetical protein
MMTATRKITNNYKHKKKRTRTTKIKITTPGRSLITIAKKKAKEDNNQHDDHY